MKKVGSIIFGAHVRGCVRDAVAEQEDDEVIKELIDVLNRFMN